MAKRTAPQADRHCLFGDTAGALEITLSLLLDAVAVTAPVTAQAMLGELDALLARRLPTPGLHANLVVLRDHLAALLAISGAGGLPN